MFPNKVREKLPERYQHDFEKLKEIVHERIQYVRLELESEEMISQSTFKDSKIDKNFLIKYNIAE